MTGGGYKEDKTLKKWLQEAYGASDRQLLRELGEAERIRIPRRFDLDSMKKRMYEKIAEC